MIKIDFTIEKDSLSFTDAIVLPDDHDMTDAEIEAMKQARFDAWYAIVTAPSEDEPVEEPVEEPVSEI